MDDTLQRSAFYPELLLSPIELRRVKHLFKRLDAISPETLDARAWNSYWEKKRPISEELFKLSAEVLFRQTGIEEFMVVSVQRDDGYLARLQVLQVEIIDNARRRSDSVQLYWVLRGRALKKDETLGSKDQSIGFRRACVLRRKLDNTWDKITPRMYRHAT